MRSKSKAAGFFLSIGGENRVLNKREATFENLLHGAGAMSREHVLVNLVKAISMRMGFYDGKALGEQFTINEQDN